MKPRLIGLLTLAAIMSLAAVVLAQTVLDSTFTYQGQIKKDGLPVTESCDFIFMLFDANTGGSQLGGTRTLNGVTVNNGLCTVALDLGTVFTGDKRWLEIRARCPAGSGTVATLSPRQELTGSPHAAFAVNAGAAATSASTPWSGLTGVPASVSTVTASGALATEITPVDGREVAATLAQLPLATWRYKSQAEGIRHMGPMAQDFYAALGLGEDDKYISTIDADGVALAAIQGLYQELKDRDAKIATLEARLTELERVLKQLPAHAATHVLPGNWESCPRTTGRQ